VTALSPDEAARLFELRSFGNGGSATDAQQLATLFLNPRSRRCARTRSASRPPSSATLPTIRRASSSSGRRSAARGSSTCWWRPAAQHLLNRTR
jgi:hypothetical protein